MEKILSVIVPVYNVERFLPRCLDSLLRQGMQSGEWEVICVDDGSTDGCAAILADYAQRYPDVFRVIRQENQGLGPARNTGMAVAQGEYIGFVDSDDYIIDGAYAYFCQHFLGKKPDVLSYNDKIYIYTDGKTIVDPDAKPDGVITFDGDGAEAYNRLELPYVWSKIYKRSFLEHYGIKEENTVCQDELFNFEVFRHHPHILIVSSNVSRYEQGNEHSIQKTLNEKRIKAQLDELLFHNAVLMEKYLQESNGEMAAAARRNLNNFLNIYHKKILRVYLPWKEWRRYKKRLQELPVYTYPNEMNRMARWVTLLKNLSGKVYLVYMVLYLFNRYYFRGNVTNNLRTLASKKNGIV